MGRKGSWFSAVRKALSPEPKEKKEKSQKTNKSKKQWFGKQRSLDTDIVVPAEPAVTTIPAPHSPPVAGEVKLTEAENEQSKHAYSVAYATAVAAEAAVAAAQAAAEVVRLTTVARYSGKSIEEIAAIRIQTAFRGYLARRALRALRGLVRLKKLIQGQSVKRQATTTLRCMQTLARVQSQVRARRLRMSEENQALQRQLLQKRERELDHLRASIDSWDDSTHSKEHVEASLQMKQEAAMRRERALAYSYSHQQMWKNSSKSANPTFMDPNNPHWGWSWLERWMAARPWESRSATDDHASIRSSTRGGVGEISRSYSRRDLSNDNKVSPAGQKSSRRQSASTTPSKTPSEVGRRIKPSSPKGSVAGTDEDSRSIYSVQSERYRRHSIAGSSVRDDESLASSPAIPSYMSSTKSANAKSRLTSPLGLEKKGSSEKGSSVGSAKKRLSFTASPAAARRHSGPPRVETTTVTDIRVK